MKISSTSEPLRPDRLLPTANEARTAAAKAGETVAETEKVQLSDLATRLSKLENRFGGDFDAKKVNEVKTAMAEGRFTVNADAVAQGLIASVAELLGKKA
ncbi:MAG: flagellar biosynthesis anti-sigma factor FlgM [Betaproteobacteria bacterium]